MCADLGEQVIPTLDAAYDPSQLHFARILALTVTLSKPLAIVVGGKVINKALEVVADLVKEGMKSRKINDAEVVVLYDAGDNPVVEVKRKPVSAGAKIDRITPRERRDAAE